MTFTGTRGVLGRWRVAPLRAVAAVMLVSSVLLGVVGLSSCKTAPPPPDRQAQLVAVAHLQEAGRLVAKAIASEFFKRKHTERAIREQQTARALLVESSS